MVGFCEHGNALACVISERFLAASKVSLFLLDLVPWSSM
jgi:hypothetical protein